MATTAFVSKNGDIIRWEIPIVNNGAQPDTNITVTGAYPSGVLYTSHNPVSGTTFNSSTPQWTVPSLNPGDTKTLVVFTKVTDITLAPFVWTLTIDGDNTDNVSGNNELVLTVEVTTCPPSAGAVDDTSACLCGNVTTNDTLCSSGTTEIRLGTTTNLAPEFTIGLDGSYNTNGMILDPFSPATFTYSIWCIVGEDEFETSGPATVTIPALFHPDVVLVGDDTLEALSAFNQNGLLTQTAPDTFVGRTINGTTNEIEVTNGDGVLGNPVISIPSTFDLSGKSILRIPHNAAPILANNGDTGIDSTVTDFSIGVLKFYSTQAQAAISVPVTDTATMRDGMIPEYDAANNRFSLLLTPSILKLRVEQTGTSDPTFVTFKNTTGAGISITRNDVGRYNIAADVSVFLEPDTFFPGAPNIGTSAKPLITQLSRVDDDNLLLEVYDPAGNYEDLEGQLTLTVEIYPA